MDRRRVVRPPQPPAPAAAPDLEQIALRMRRRAAWLRMQARICVVLIAVLLAGGGVIFLDARTIARTELDALPELKPPPSLPVTTSSAPIPPAPSRPLP